MRKLMINLYLIRNTIKSHSSLERSKRNRMMTLYIFCEFRVRHHDEGTFVSDTKTNAGWIRVGRKYCSAGKEKRKSKGRRREISHAG